ncbi:hypothetical protein HPB50_009287 [Hyalomma asiaticum]|uniref:Uncharacterized protein n=1 Tax=Hyalomma asiaticum TaxID=266040 RepID=A0ACB7THK1_HYAAI|nr:hypothetical protein HPB50_009287 [Hyalomma asiaticum]
MDRCADRGDRQPMPSRKGGSRLAGDDVARRNARLTFKKEHCEGRKGGRTRELESKPCVVVRHCSDHHRSRHGSGGGRAVSASHAEDGSSDKRVNARGRRRSAAAAAVRGEHCLAPRRRRRPPRHEK